MEAGLTTTYLRLVSKMTKKEQEDQAWDEHDEWAWEEWEFVNFFRCEEEDASYEQRARELAQEKPNRK